MLERARRAANEPATHWRLLYDLPETDPRWLDATDDQILHDLLVRSVIAQGRKEVGEEFKDPDMLARMQARALQNAQDPKTLETIRRLRGDSPAKPRRGP